MCVGAVRRLRRAGSELEEGSEPVSFVLVQFVVLLVFLALLQCTLIIHTHNTLISVAGEAARRYAMLDGDDSDARQYVVDVCDELLGSGRVSDIELSRERHEASGYEVAVVRIRSALPVIWRLGPPVLLGQGSAVVERSLP